MSDSARQDQLIGEAISCLQMMRSAFTRLQQLLWEWQNVAPGAVAVEDKKIYFFAPDGQGTKYFFQIDTQQWPLPYTDLEPYLRVCLEQQEKEKRHG